MLDNRSGNRDQGQCQDGGRSYRSTLRAGPVFVLAVAAVLFTLAGCAGGPLAALASSPGGRITKGPCLLRVYQDRAALMWETDVEGPWSVRCETEGRPESRHDSERPEGLSNAYIHKVWMDGLEPGRQYRYRIVGPNVRSETYEFRTVPAKTDEVRFVIYGDTRTNVSVHRRLVEQIMKHELDFVVHVGDLVARGDEYRQWGPQFFEPMKGLVERVPLYIARGNHEGRNGTYEKLLLPPGENGDVGFDYGPLHLFCADNVSQRADANDLALNIARDARASEARWKFVVYHVPSVNFGGHWSSWRQQETLPAFAKAGVDFVVTGHSHHYERFRPVAPLGQGHYVTYITSGGGGAPLYEVEPTAYHALAKSVHQFCLFHIKGDTLTMDTIGVDGRIIDHITIVKEDGRPDKQYAQAAVPMGGIQLHTLLYENLAVRLPERPKKGSPFVVNVDLVVPELPDDAKLTFKLQGDSAAYDLPPIRVVAVPRRGGPVHVELMAMPSVAVRSSGSGKAARMEPSLRLECRYEIGEIRETLTRSLTIADN